jgi:molybdopterin converting factor small subunit
MEKHIEIHLYATLKAYTPSDSEKYPIIPGTKIKVFLENMKVPIDQVKLIFVDNKKADLDDTLNGGERVGIFPAVGGG